jgi:WD40 repeat protein
MSAPSELLFTLSGHTGSVYELCDFGANDFISSGSDRMIVQWSALAEGDGNLLTKATDAVFSMKHLGIAKKLLIGTANGSIHVFDLKEMKESRTVVLHEGAVFRIVSNSSETRIFTLGADGILTVSDEAMNLIRKVRIAEVKLRAAVFSIDEQYLIIGSMDGVITIVDAASLNVSGRFQAHRHGFGVNCIAFSKDNMHYYTGSRDAHLNIYSSSDHRLIRSLPAHHAAIYDIAFHPSGKYFATASRDKLVKLWSAEAEVISRLEGHRYSVNRLLWKDDRLFSAGDDRKIFCWKPQISQ